MWYVLRFEHAHGLKRYNDRRMTRGQTTCSLGDTASLGLLLPENDCSSDRLLILLRESCRHSKSCVKAVDIFFCFLLLSQHLLLYHVMKVCHVCYYNNSVATFRLLTSGDINPSPGPVSDQLPGDKCQKLKQLSQRQHNKLAIRA